MDLENIFRDVKLSKTEMTVLRSIQHDPERCVREDPRRRRALLQQSVFTGASGKEAQVQRLAGAGLFY